MNASLGVMGFFLCHSLLRANFPNASSSTVALRCFLVFFFPVYFTYMFLFYTDVASVCLVLLMLLMAVKKRPMLSQVVGCISVTVRQSNIIWTAYAAFLGMLAMSKDKRPAKQNQGFTHEPVDFLLWTKQHPMDSLRVVLPCAIVWCLSFSFTVWNGGVAFGDRDAQTARLHLVQVMYCTTFAFLSMAPALADPSIAVLIFGAVRTSLRKSPMICMTLTAMLLMFILYAVKYHTYAHPYLLADNRHIIFYLWKDVIRPFKWYLVPVYAVSFIGLLLLLGAGSYGHVSSQWPKLQAAALLACVSASVVPYPLLELRYFIMPVICVMVQVRPSRPSVALVHIACFVLMDAFMLYLFTRRNFVYADGSVGRIIW